MNYRSHTPSLKLFTRHKQLISVFAALLILLAQAGSLWHAAEHPFHAQEELCVSFIKFGQQDQFYHVISPLVEVQSIFIEMLTENRQSIISPFRQLYSPRAPPVS